MPRLVDLALMGRVFRASLAVTAESWVETERLVPAQRKSLAEDAFLRVVIAWEGFVSDWFVGCVSHDSTRFARDLNRKIAVWFQGQVSSSPYRRYAQQFQPPKIQLTRHPGLGAVRELLDSRERNVEFASFADLRDRSNAQLASRYAARVRALDSAGVGELIDCGTALRNVLAHRSGASVREANRRVANCDVYPSLRKPTMSSRGVGTYLVARAQGGPSRLETYLDEYDKIASVLTP